RHVDAVLARRDPGSARGPVEIDGEIVLALARAVVDAKRQRPKGSRAELEAALLDDGMRAKQPGEAARRGRRLEAVGRARLVHDSLHGFAHSAAFVGDVVAGLV